MPPELDFDLAAAGLRADDQDVRIGLEDLSVNEFLLIKQAGFDPLGLVVGSSIYHIGIQVAGWKKSQEMTVLSEAMYQARQLAMTRMEEEADQLGADGVVGVRLDIGRYEWGQDMAEFIAIGTAVKHREGVLHRAPNGRGSSRWSACRARPRSSAPRGIVGVQLQEKSHGWGSQTIEFFAVGTAIVPREGEQSAIEAPTPVLDLSS